MRKALQIAGMSLSALFGNWARSILTTLGIVIGVAAVILIMSLGAGVQSQITGQLDELGPNLITVAPGSGGASEAGAAPDEGGGPGESAAAVSTLTTKDAGAVAKLPSVIEASSSVSVTLPIEGAGYSFTGVDPSYQEISSVKLQTGRFVQDDNELVLTAASAKDLLNSGPEASVGETLAIRGEDYEVVGISRESTGGGFAAGAASSYMITGDALSLSGAENVSQITALAKNPDAVDATARDISAELKAAHGGAEDFSVTTQEQLLSSFTQITNVLTIGLTGIAGISLLVGGIGVMNIMLVSVTERTREIGVRKALGASNADVLSQFLLEAVLLSVFGGLVGIGVGVGVSALLPTLSANLATAVTLNSVLIASGASVLIGIIFGVLPAYRSAGLQPVEALRRE
ncbi:MAG: Macrolide export ATP-binding/permease protein MacB [uncultured Rubrobacteraceae bacterium]|uniref:Macrolide export ATP-binding/permease protein MacB n=1 Tax=uncultured Rubrobacteraceae bacterium TaxID=349277 RepID=A0A6J4R141_9ACTN|nr:MAG: Macrolide export ATP-binding/permease protein MacB [uncultured Rubrobacteraceae bacterium]